MRAFENPKHQAGESTTSGVVSTNQCDCGSTHPMAIQLIYECFPSLIISHLIRRSRKEPPADMSSGR